ncbi:hypothetical protein B0O99DRAFT_602896 [Bisporella sp. PMI_857]|nr:hypothetical protein B0O99DRAFT_602896 [Bisporella sp. PMI_857]
MNVRWTREDIILILISKGFSQLEGIPIRAFISFPFGPRYEISPADFYDKEQCAQQYPPILYLGIVLLEIGLGQALRLERNSKLSLLAHENTGHAKAKTKLKELKNAKWGGFRWRTTLLKLSRTAWTPSTSKRLRKARYSDAKAIQMMVIQTQLIHRS